MRARPSSNPPSQRKWRSRHRAPPGTEGTCAPLIGEAAWAGVGVRPGTSSSWTRRGPGLRVGVGNHCAPVASQPREEAVPPTFAEAPARACQRGSLQLELFSTGAANQEGFNPSYGATLWNNGTLLSPISQSDRSLFNDLGCVED